MKNIYTTIIVLVLVVLGFVFFMSRENKDNKAEAPAAVDNSHQVSTMGDEKMKTMPIVPEAPENTSKVVEKIVNNADSPVKEFVVIGQNFSFTPNLITVKKGDKVKITFKNVSGFHDFKIDDYGIVTRQSKSPSQEVLEFTADKTGSFQYYCPVGSHRAMGMWGTLKVE